VTRRRDPDLGVLLNANVASLHAVLRAAARTSPETRVVSLSSSAVYGAGHHGPVREGAALRPVTAYGLSKAAGEEVAACFRDGGMDVVVVRPFNLIGPGLPRGTLLADVADHLIAHRPVRVGDLSARRDLLDVRDAVTAIAALTLLDTGVECVNVGSGTSRPVADAVATMLEIAGQSRELVDSGTRPGDAADIDDQVADVSLLQRLVPEWSPTIALDETVRDILEHQRQTVGDGT
jgi:GDP-4-dehydro-6-deoxy-D-mannose reductase